MDYSLLVGIHDPSIPYNFEAENGDEGDKEETFDYEEQGGDPVSSDEFDTPNSPSSVTGDFIAH